MKACSAPSGARRLPSPRREARGTQARSERTKNKQSVLAARFSWLSEFGVFYCWALSRHYPRWLDDLEQADELWGLLTRVDYASIMSFEIEFDALRQRTPLAGTPSIARQWADVAQRARRSILLQLAGSLRLSGLSTSDALANYRASWWQDASSLTCLADGARSSIAMRADSLTT